jgi:4-amino-4-deoxy-L-arabinose transferase-like glycosyltransferase
MAIKKFIKERSSLLILFCIFLFSFLLDIYILTRYNLSYGMDGPFYDLKVLSIIQTGFPASNDPPLVYYLLTPFVALIGNSFLGIKIGMSLLGSLMVFPTYYLTEMFSKKLIFETKVPALLSAFLITINLCYFQMIGDFMQNLVGVLFLLLLIYFTVKWLENSGDWKKYGTITIVLLICNILIHIYTGMIAVIIFVSLLIFNLIITRYKTGHWPVFELKIFGLILALILGSLFVMFTVYPIMFSKFNTVLSFFSGTTSLNQGIQNSINITIFMTIPFILGVYATIKVLYNGLIKKNSIKRVIDKKTLLSFAYLVMTLILVILSVVPSDYQNRFIAMAFVPIALLTPLGLKFIESKLSVRYSGKNNFKIGVICIIGIIFAMSSFYTSIDTFSDLSPSISSAEYNNLTQIKANYIPDKIDPNRIIMVNDYHSGYWVQYILGMQVETGNLTEIEAKYPNKKIYAISFSQTQVSNTKANYQLNWDLLLPYSFPFGGFDLLSYLRSSGLPLGNDSFNINKGSPNIANKNLTHNSSNNPPNHPNGTDPINGSIQMPQGFGNNGGINGGIGYLSMEISSSSSIIFNGGTVKIYELT